MNADDVRIVQQRREVRTPLDTRHRIAGHGIVGGDVHAEREAISGDLPADPAEADQAERAARQLTAAKRVAVPLAGADRRVSRRDPAHQREQQRPRVLGGGANGPQKLGLASQAQHLDVLPPCALQIDVVEPRRRRHDRLQPRPGLEHLVVYLMPEPDDEGIGGPDRREQRRTIGRGLVDVRNGLEQPARFIGVVRRLRIQDAPSGSHKSEFRSQESGDRVSTGSKEFRSPEAGVRVFIDHEEFRVRIQESERLLPH